MPLVILGRRSTHCVVFAALSLYGILLFRIALGRSDLPHVLNASPPALFLFMILIERAWEHITGLSHFPRRRPVRFLAGALCACCAVLVATPIASEDMRSIVMAQTKGPGPASKGTGYPLLAVLDGTFLSSAEYDKVASAKEFIDGRHLSPGEYVYFFPNEPMFYFLFDLPSPTRFPMVYQAVTSEYRAEVVRDLDRLRPAYLVYNGDTYRIDDIPEETQVPEILTYLKANYTFCSKSDGLFFYARAGRTCAP